MVPRRATNRSLEEAGLNPLSLLLEKCAPDALILAQEKLKSVDSSELVSMYTSALAESRRVPAFLLALVLTERGIAPGFRRPLTSPPETKVLTINDEYDRLVYDMMWLAAWHPEHKPTALPGIKTDPTSWKRLFSFTDRHFYLGNTPLWLIVKKLKLSERQQWECRLLRSLPIKRRAAGLDQSTQQIYAKLAETVPSIMRTMPKDEASERQAHAILRRRKRLWVCAEISGWSPTETARIYKLMTGEALTKSQAANQLAAISEYRRKRKRSAEAPAADDE